MNRMEDTEESKMVPVFLARQTDNIINWERECRTQRMGWVHVGPAKFELETLG